jgi:hypothetical protein
MLTGVLDSESASDLEFGEDTVAGFHGEAVDEDLCDGFADASGAAEGDVAELIAERLDLGNGRKFGGGLRG